MEKWSEWQRRWSILGRTVDLEILFAVSAYFGNSYALYMCLDCKIFLWQKMEIRIVKFFRNDGLPIICSNIPGYCYPEDVWNWVIGLVFFVVSNDTVSWGKTRHWKTFLFCNDTFQPSLGWYCITIVE